MQNLYIILAIGVGASSVLTSILFLLQWKQTLQAGEDALMLRVLGRDFSSRGLGIMTRYAVAQYQPDSDSYRKLDYFVRQDATEKAAQISAEKDTLSRDVEVVFIGSTTFTYWLNLQEDIGNAVNIPPKSIYNAAFGGSRVGDVNLYLDTLIFPLEPQVIVYYCGVNDLMRTAPPEYVLDQFKIFFDRTITRLPHVKILVLGVMPSPVLRTVLGIEDEARKANQLVKDFLEGKNKGDLMLKYEFCECSVDECGQWDLYLNDGQHLRPHGHKKLASVLQPALLKLIPHNLQIMR